MPGTPRASTTQQPAGGMAVDAAIRKASHTIEDLRSVQPSLCECLRRVAT